VLESTAANVLQLRRLLGTGPAPGGTGPYVVFSFAAPTACTVPGVVPGSAAMAQAYRHTFTLGDTLTVNLCTEGSLVLVNVMDESSVLGLVPPVVQFRCWRQAGNANMCQRVF
jgi:hypothetical protein